MSLTYRDDLSGKKFCKLLVLDHVKTDSPKTVWRCRCDCGEEILAFAGDLKSGNTKSCGCFRRENTSRFAKIRSRKHGMFGTRLYNIWDSMKARCFNKNHTAYKNYGGRGIKVCDEWRKDFVLFHDWAINNGYSDGLTIDRIDVNGDYEPSNCRWIPMAEQAKNRRNTIYIEAFGEKKCVSDWSLDYGVPRKVILSRIRYGWNPERAITQNVKSNKAGR